MEAFFKNKSLIEMISRWKIHLILITVISAAIGTFISSPIIITPKFKSTAILYPVNIHEYSKESTTEQMLQVFNSNDIKERMLAAFNLDKHYKLDKNNPQFYSYFLGEYTDNVSISKTEYESVELKVLDADPKIASDMVDSLIVFYDEKTASMHKKKQKEVIDISLNQFKIKSRELDSLEGLLNNFRRTYGIMNYNSQVSEATKGELSGNNSAKELFKKLQDYGVEYQRVDSLLYNTRREYLFNKYTIEQAEKEYNKKISYSQVVSSPYPADKKTTPVRWAIVAITVIASLLFSLIAIAFIDSKQKKA